MNIFALYRNFETTDPLATNSTGSAGFTCLALGCWVLGGFTGRADVSSGAVAMMTTVVVPVSADFSFALWFSTWPCTRLGISSTFDRNTFSREMSVFTPFEFLEFVEKDSNGFPNCSPGCFVIVDDTLVEGCIG
jgi:hypothetical protein